MSRLTSLSLVLIVFCLYGVPSWSLTLSHGGKNHCPPERHEMDSVQASASNGVATRRSFGAISAAIATGTRMRIDLAYARQSTRPENMVLVKDPHSYEALFYAPPPSSSTKDNQKAKLPLLLILPGAGQNDEDAWSLADPQGEHRGLAPSLLASGQAPMELSESFCVLAPYPAGKRSFYEEPRGKILSFLNWALSDEGAKAGIPVDRIDTDRLCLFGFSDGATLAVELATTQRFRAVVVAAYGFTGTLPSLALQRLASVPMWVFHSADDVIYSVRYSDNLVKSLQSAAADANQKAITGSTKSYSNNRIRYTRYNKDPEGCTGSVQGHCVGITASKTPEIYKWMLDVTAERSKDENKIM